MPTLDDVRRFALSFPDTIEKVDGHRGGATWRMKSGAFVWERGPAKADIAALADLDREWPDGAVVAVRTDGLETKEALIGSYPDVFFSIPHFDRYPAALVQLEKIEPGFLREVITDAWIVMAPPRVSKAWLAENG